FGKLQVSQGLDSQNRFGSYDQRKTCGTFGCCDLWSTGLHRGGIRQIPNARRCWHGSNLFASDLRQETRERNERVACKERSDHGKDPNEMGHNAKATCIEVVQSERIQSCSR